MRSVTRRQHGWTRALGETAVCNSSKTGMLLPITVAELCNCFVYANTGPSRRISIAMVAGSRTTSPPPTTFPTTWLASYKQWLVSPACRTLSSRMAGSTSVSGGTMASMRLRFWVSCNRCSSLSLKSFVSPLHSSLLADPAWSTSGSQLSSSQG